MVQRLVGVIEKHSHDLTERLVKRLRSDPRTSAYRRLDDQEMRIRVERVYAHLGQWLGETAEGAVEEEYLRLGAGRCREGIPLSEVVAALLLTRRNLWEFIEEEPGDTLLELHQKLDLELLVVRFFDRAIYYAVRGYEAHRARGDVRK